MSDLMCPILTAATLKSAPQKTVLVGAPGQKDEEVEAVTCVGSSCAWWQPVVDEKGLAKGGNCAIQMLPLALSQITGGLSNVVGLVAQRLPVIPNKTK